MRRRIIRYFVLWMKRYEVNVPMIKPVIGYIQHECPLPKALISTIRVDRVMNRLTWSPRYAVNNEALASVFVLELDNPDKPPSFTSHSV